MGVRSSREVTIQNASCQMGGREVTRWTASFCNERLRSYREINQHPSLPWNFITHGFLGLAPLQKVVGDFCCIKFGGFCRGFSWRIFLGTFSPQKRGEKIRRQNPRQNPAARKEKSTKNPFCQKPALRFLDPSVSFPEIASRFFSSRLRVNSTCSRPIQAGRASPETIANKNKSRADHP